MIDLSFETFYISRWHIMDVAQSQSLDITALKFGPYPFCDRCVSNIHIPTSMGFEGTFLEGQDQWKMIYVALISLFVF